MLVWLRHASVHHPLRGPGLSSSRARMRLVNGLFQLLARVVSPLEDAQLVGCDTSQQECSSCGMCYYNERRPSRHL